LRQVNPYHPEFKIRFLRHCGFLFSFLSKSFAVCVIGMLMHFSPYISEENETN
jgi:hypothetical protein